MPSLSIPVNPGEKFAFIAFECCLDRHVENAELAPGLHFIRSLRLSIPDHWREAMGSHSADSFRSCNATILARAPASNTEVFDDEDRALLTRVGHWFTGLGLATRLHTTGDPFRISGVRAENELLMRQLAILPRIEPNRLTHERPIKADALVRATTLGAAIDSFALRQGPTPSWRLSRCLRLYEDTCHEREPLERLHQFTRCIEGLMATSQGKSAEQFGERSSIFCGSNYRSFMENIYKTRGKIEHLHEEDLLGANARQEREMIAKQELVASEVARTCLERILNVPALLENFSSQQGIKAFWEKSEEEKTEAWGAPLDVKKLLRQHEAVRLTDAQLGL